MNEKQTKGFVYVLTNPCFKDNWIKIGFAIDVDKRVKELSGVTGMPLPFEVFATLKTTKYKEAERMIHKMIGKFSPEKRINPSREFFNIEPQDAFEVFEIVSKILVDAELHVKAVSLKDKKAPIKRTFTSMGLNSGDVIEFLFEPKFKATISGERTVNFEGKEWLLSALGIELYERIERRVTFGSVFDVFKYDDKDRNLNDRWRRFNQQKSEGD